MTILFKNDWNDYPSAVVDYNTSNKSFLKLVSVYKRMGIVNCEFILALMQPELSGVDPFDENLDAETKYKIAMECRYNPWYFFREVCRIPPTSGNVPVRFKANRGNIALYWCFFNHVDFALLQPRQTGKSVSTDCLMTGIINLWASNTTVNLITKDLALRNANVQRLKEIRNLLPEYIYYPNALDADNSELITNLRLVNRYKTAVGRNDKIAADKLGRGLTVPIMHFDELCYINMIELSLPVALSSGSAARDEAKAEDQPYGNIFTTTAGNINSRDGGYAYRFMTGGMPWDEFLFDIPNRKKLERVVEKGSTGTKPLIYGAFNHRQLGRSDEWLYGKLRETASHGELADRDYFNIWTTGTEGSPMSSEDKQKLKNGEMDPLWTQITEDGYAIRWYIPADQIQARLAGGSFILGTDPSEALGQNNDATGLVLLDAYTHDVVMTGRFNETSIDRLSLFIAQLLIQYPTITFIPERKSTGSSILEVLFVQLPQAGIDPFKRIYNRIVDEPEKHESEFKEIQKPLSSRSYYFYDRYKRYFGFVTAGAGKHARDVLYVDSLRTALQLGAKRVYDKTLVNELLSLTIRDGRIDHSKGNHDDMVVSWLLTHWFCTKARNLSYYGIKANQIFSIAQVDEEGMSPEELYRQQVKRHHMEEFNELVEEFKKCTDHMMVLKLEAKLRQISKYVDVQEATGVGIDAMIKHAQEERQRKTKMNRGGTNNPYSMVRLAA